MDALVNDLSDTGIVIIGRNEGERLKRCLRSLPPTVAAIYVDSGSTDGSASFARSIGVYVVELDLRTPFTAARARNVGWRTLAGKEAGLEFVQFVDGDCEVAENWLAVARDALILEHRTAAVFGRLRERFPNRSIYNRMCDDEWASPIGLVEACGGNSMFRLKALSEAQGYSDDLIAGEEPDLCTRLLRTGWQIRCLNHEMAAHDAAITSFGAFWRRTKRSGFAFAEHVWRHGRKGIPSWQRQLIGIVLWGLLLPLAGLVCLALYALAGMKVGLALLVACLLAYPIQMTRVALRKNEEVNDPDFAAAYGVLIVIGKFAQALGTLECWSVKFRGRRPQLIEYKRS